jgi:hypothetical protein
MNNEFIINGGPYLVKTNEYGGIIQEYGWASLKIVYQPFYTHISILCNDRTLNINDNIVYHFTIKKKIDDLEQISRSLSRGFNSLYSYNFAKLDIFIDECKYYFEQL